MNKKKYTFGKKINQKNSLNGNQINQKMSNRNRKNSKKQLHPVARATLYLFSSMIFLAITIAILLCLMIILVYPKLPEIDELSCYQPKLPLQVYSADHVLLGQFGDEKRSFLTIKETPELLKNAIIAAEDERFYTHHGIDYIGMIRATINNIFTGKMHSGASTITMQVARNFFLSSQKTFTRKFSEILLAYKIDASLTKDKILELYINQIFLGNRAYGFAEASNRYFGKNIKKINLAEYAMLAGLPKAPSAYNPIANPKRATERQRYVLKRMLTLNMIDDHMYHNAIEYKIKISNSSSINTNIGSFVAEMARIIMYDKYGDNIYSRGYKVYTTIDSKMQLAAYNTLRAKLLDFSLQKDGYSGPEEYFELNNLLYKNNNSLDTTSNKVKTSNRVDVHKHKDNNHQNKVAELNKHIHKHERKYDHLADALSNNKNQIHQNLKHVTDSVDKDALLHIFDGLIDFGNLIPVLVLPKDISDNEVQSNGYNIEEAIISKGKNLYFYAMLRSGEIIKISVNKQLGSVKNYINKYPEKIRPGAIIRVLQPIDHNYNKELQYSIPNQIEGYKGNNQARALYNKNNLISHEWVIYSTPKIEGATISVDANTGQIKALIGGFDFNKNSYNHATQSYRQPGSSFKPFIYSAAIEKGIATDEEFVDEQICFDTNYGSIFNEQWCPKNFDNNFMGKMGLRQAFALSRNTIAVALLNKISPEYAIGHLSKFGFDTRQFKPYLTLALGATEVTPLQMAKAYSVFANGGYLVSPYFIDKITDNNNKTLAITQKITLSEDQRVLDSGNGFIMNTMLQDVVKFGTAHLASDSIARSDIAGKTGTTNDSKDVWFNGYVGSLVTVVWIGYDQPKSLGHQGGASLALPVWVDFIKQIEKSIAKNSIYDSMANTIHIKNALNQAGEFSATNQEMSNHEAANNQTGNNKTGNTTDISKLNNTSPSVNNVKNDQNDNTKNDDADPSVNQAAQSKSLLNNKQVEIKNLHGWNDQAEYILN